MMTPPVRIFRYDEPRPCPGRTKPATGRRLTALEAAGALTEPPPPPEPNLLAGYTKATLKYFVTPRVRRAMNRDLKRRNDLDRAFAEARGLTPTDPRCARFQGPEYWNQLDSEVRRRRSVA